jgi:hypothetical protein
VAHVRFTPKATIADQNVIRRYVRDAASCRLKHGMLLRWYLHTCSNQWAIG